MLIKASQPPVPNKRLYPLAISRPSHHKPFPVKSSPPKIAPTSPSARLQLCRSRRRVRHEEESKGEEEDSEYGHNADISMLESYTESSPFQALLVRATVDGGEEEILIFRGYSSGLSFGTSVDPSKSVVPARAVIQSVDIIKGPFDPSCIHYLEKDLTWDEFKFRLHTTSK